MAEATRVFIFRASGGGSNASMLLVTVPFNPYSDTLWPFVQAARKAIDGAVSAGRGRGRARQEERAVKGEEPGATMFLGVRRGDLEGVLKTLGVASLEATIERVDSEDVSLM